MVTEVGEEEKNKRSFGHLAGNFKSRWCVENFTWDQRRRVAIISIWMRQEVRFAVRVSEGVGTGLNGEGQHRAGGTASPKPKPKNKVTRLNGEGQHRAGGTSSPKPRPKNKVYTPKRTFWTKTGCKRYFVCFGV